MSAATDIYCLGAVLYKVLTGSAPHYFDERSVPAVASSILTRAIRRPSQLAPELRGDLEFILLKTLQKDPQERYASVEQFTEDLEAFLESRAVRA